MLQWRQVSLCTRYCASAEAKNKEINMSEQKPSLEAILDEYSPDSLEPNKVGRVDAQKIINSTIHFLRPVSFMVTDFMLWMVLIYIFPLSLMTTTLITTLILIQKDTILCI